MNPDSHPFQRGGIACQGGAEPAVRPYRLQALAGQFTPVPARRARLEAVVVAFERVLGGEGLQEGHPAGQLGQPARPARSSRLGT